MPEIIRTKDRVYREDYSSDDERSSSYGRSRPSGGYTTVQRYRVTPSRQLQVAEADDDRRSVRSERSDRLDVGTRHHRLEVDRRVERVDQIERPRSALEYREPEREREVKRTVVYERERPRERSREPLSPRGGERERERDVPYERERETDIRVERRREREEEPVEYERVSRETEYYGRPDPPQPVIIREPPVEKYEVVRREQFVDNREVAPPRRQEDEYYYRRDVRQVEPRKDEVARYERKDIRPRDSVSDDGSDSEVYVRREKRIVRDRSHSPRHKLHLAEGALAGAGAAALIANHREKSGDISEHRGRKVAGGALAGALGAELVTRARSRYRDKSRDRSRSRTRSSSRGGGNHTKLRTGLALAATALAAAAAGKYIASRNDRKEDARGRSRTRSVSRRRRYSSDDDAAEGGGKHGAKHRAAAIAKAGASAAVVGAIADHIRSKSQGRSKSRLRTGGVAAATGLAGAAIAGIYEARKAKQDATDAETARGRNHTSRSRSRARSVVYDDPAVDPELGMVEYGTNPVYTQRNAYYDPAAVAAEHSQERRSSRSRSRVRDIASGAFATGAAAVGINKYQKRRERKEAERERREAERERRRYEEEAPSPEEHYYAQGYDDRYTPSPPHASGGAYVNEPPPQAPPVGYTQQTTTQTTQVNEYPPHSPYDPAHQPPYNPAEYPAAPPPPMDPYGYPAPREAREGGNVSSMTPFAPQAQPSPPRALYNMSDEEARIMTPTSSVSSGTFSPTHEQPHNKSVTFAPLSPSSTRTLTKSRNRRNSDPSSDRPNTPSQHRRRHRNASHSPSPTSSDEVEVLPDRFDRDGHPLGVNTGHAKPKQTEMAERIVHDFEDVIGGRQSWRSLLRGFFDEAGGGGGGGGGGRRR